MVFENVPKLNQGRRKDKRSRLIGEKAKDLIKTLSEDIINKYAHITYYYQHSYPTKSGVCL